jgi:hypothetical protein
MRRFLLVFVFATLALIAACGDDDNGTTPGDNTSPIRVTNLAVVDAGDNTLTLEWTAPGDDGASGTATSYQIRMSDSPINAANFAAATPVLNPPTPVGGGNTQGFIVTGVDTTLETHFALRAVDDAGNTSQVSNDAAWTPPHHLAKDIPPFKDTSMYEESDTLSNGAGSYLFCGKTAGAIPPGFSRRALLAFAIADSLPNGAVIDSVVLTLHLSKRPVNTAYTFSLHRMTADWGQGASNAGANGGGGAPAQTDDATWGYRFFDTTTWSAAGGDYIATASAQAPAGTLGFYTWKSATMTADVQTWLDIAGNNFGWILIGDESVIRTAKRFDSRENATVANRPVLRVYYTMVTR